MTHNVKDQRTNEIFRDLGISTMSRTKKKNHRLWHIHDVKDQRTDTSTSKMSKSKNIIEQNAPVQLTHKTQQPAVRRPVEMSAS